MQPVRRTLEFLRPYRARVFLGVFLTLFVTVLQILPPRVYEFAIDQAIKPALVARETITKSVDATQVATAKDYLATTAPETLMWIALSLIFIVVFRNLIAYFNSYTLAWIGNRFVFDLRFALWRHLHRLSLTFHNQTQTGKIMARVTSDIELIQGLIQGQLITFISDLVTLIFVFALLFTLEWRLAVIILALVPFYVVSYLAFLKNIRTIGNEQRRLYDEMVGILAEKIAGIQVVKAFVREDLERESFMSAVRRKYLVDMRQIHLNRRLGLVSAVISAIGTGIVYSYGGHLVQAGEMTTGKLVAITFYISFIFNPAVRVVDFNNALQWAVTAMVRVFQTLDTRPDVSDAENAPQLPPVKGRVEFKNVVFRYVPERDVLKSLNLVVEPGEVIALVGATGAGKSTMMNLIMRFYDVSSGEILIDGHNVSNVRLDSLRGQVSMVAQENVLFSVSIAENVKYGSREATNEEVVRACQAADLHEFVMELPEGYETLIGEGGIKMSGGQKQRLALARALVTDPRILILDDVTSALDGETEARVQDSLRAVMKGRTTFIISHRLSSVVQADRIIVVRDGEIVDIGPHDELVTRAGDYQDMFREQFKSALTV